MGKSNLTGSQKVIYLVIFFSILTDSQCVRLFIPCLLRTAITTIEILGEHAPNFWQGILDTLHLSFFFKQIIIKIA